MKIQSTDKMIEKIKSGKYFIAKCYEPDDEGNDYKYYICSGKAENVTFKSITKKRADEWLKLGAELIFL